MNDQVLSVPVSLLQDRRLSAGARVIWMVSRLSPPGGRTGPKWLAAQTGLTRPTVYRGLAELAVAGWGPADPGSPAPAPAGDVKLPAELLTNRKLSPVARLLYGLLLLLPEFQYPNGSFTYAELAAHTHLSRNTLDRALTELAAAEWIESQRATRQSRIQFTLIFPGYNRGLNAIAAAERRRLGAEHAGEWLMREFLNLLSDRNDYQDEASPGFLVNPQTGELLRFDRFYPPNLAFEFHGPQHFRPTRRFTAEQVAAQRLRDVIKLGICMEQGIRVLVVQAEELTLEKMQAKIDGLLPLRDLTGHELLIEFLEHEAAQYRSKMAHI